MEGPVHLFHEIRLAELRDHAVPFRLQKKFFGLIFALAVTDEEQPRSRLDGWCGHWLFSSLMWSGLVGWVNK